MDLRPWEALLTLHGVMQRWRFCRGAGANLHMLLSSGVHVLAVETLAWLPSESPLPFACAGPVPWRQGDCARLITLITREHDWLSQPSYINHQTQDSPWLREFPQLRHILCLYLAEQAPIGWLLAINKTTSERFRRTDTALLQPFLGLIRVLHHSVGRIQELRELLFGFARSLTAAIDAKDPRRSGHSERTARIAVAIARHLSLSDADLGEIYLAGLLHDIGKLGLAEALLRKPGPWTAEELQRFQQHVYVGYTFLADLPALRNILPAVLHHHEYYDGSGYPDGLRGEEIPLIARIIAVADAYDALSTGYHDQSALPIAEVEQRLQQEAGRKWDPRVVAALIQAREELLAIRPGGVGQSFCQHMEHALQHCLNQEELRNHSFLDGLQDLASDLEQRPGRS
ncbi:MAG: HD-GYP domain-containing protein [Gemmatales bacterium]|nr:HD-GYP domain-containing protein [Gemmatales bacterium]MCS7159805.1 HD-GYP domain-containing protein [Gemmatales bacterium]MDW8175004.1 HD-GYP domain-containing protein [Gemmatales bacterium]